MRLKSSVSVISNREIAVQFLMTTSEIIRMLYQRIELGFDGFTVELPSVDWSDAPLQGEARACLLSSVDLDLQGPALQMTGPIRPQDVDCWWKHRSRWPHS